MKAKLFDNKGQSKGSIELPSVFSTKIRQDIVQKYFESDKLVQSYFPSPEAGRKHSASGTISHRRHEWKGHYGKGISRIPRKTMWRRGTQFFWVGAEISGTRGGRRAHPPKGIGKEKKINKKEIAFALNSALASTARPEMIIDRYSSLKKIEFAPAVIESIPEKTKPFFIALKSIFPESAHLVLKQKSVRAGKGKMRGRKYKSTAGLLIITATDEKTKHTGVDIKSVSDLSISDLYPLGRLALFTKKALEELAKEKKQ